jgi:hypothetical protein
VNQSFVEETALPKKKKKKADLDASGHLQPKKKKKSHVPSTSMNDLQSVEEFRHFLL